MMIEYECDCVIDAVATVTAVEVSRDEAELTQVLVSRPTN